MKYEVLTICALLIIGFACTCGCLGFDIDRVLPQHYGYKITSTRMLIDGSHCEVKGDGGKDVLFNNLNLMMRRGGCGDLQVGHCYSFVWETKDEGTLLEVNCTTGEFL